MGFRNPIVLADEVTSGNFAGQYTISGLMIVGNPNAQHVAIGTDTHGANGVRLYGADGVTPQVDLLIGSVPTVIAGTLPNGPFVKIGTTGYGIGYGITSLTGDTNQDVNGAGAWATSAGAGPTGQLMTGNYSPKFSGSAAGAALALMSATRDGTTAPAMTQLQVINSNGTDAMYEEMVPAEWRLKKTLGGSPFVKFTTTGGAGSLTFDGTTMLVKGPSFPAVQWQPNASGSPTAQLIATTGAFFIDAPGGLNVRSVINGGTTYLSSDTGGNFRANGSIVGLGTGYGLEVNAGTASGGGVNSQIAMAYQGSSQYRHMVATNHDGGTDLSNYMSFYVWHTSQATGALPDRHVLQLRGDGALLMPANGSNFDSSGNYNGKGYVRPGDGTVAHARLYSGTGVPSGPGLGATGDFYFRDDTPTVANQRLYCKNGAGAWVGIL